MSYIIILAVFVCCALQFVFRYFTTRSKPELQNNYHLVRRTQHVLTGFLILLLTEILSIRVAQLSAFMGALLIFLISMIRFYNKSFNQYFIKHFQHLLRPHEFYGIFLIFFFIMIQWIIIGFPGAFYFISGVALSLILFRKDIANLGILLATVGDPSAAIIGINFSNSYKIWGGKNIAGTIGSAIIYTIFGLLYSQITHIVIVNQQVLIGIAYQMIKLFTVGITIELLPLGQTIGKYLRIDDNFFGMIGGCCILNLIFK